MAFFDGNMMMFGLKIRWWGKDGEFTLEFALNGNIIWPNVNHVAGRIINGNPRQNNCILTNFNLAAECSVDSGSLHNNGDAAGYSIRKELGIPGDMDVPMDIPGSYDGAILYDDISTNSAWAGDSGTATDTGIIPQDCISVHIGIFCCDSIICNPALSILT